MELSAVVTTGIYCRAGCVAKPHQRNVERFPSASAAEVAGFRPCLRCRPELAPATTAPTGLVPLEQAMVLISEGFLDDADEHDLAARVGYSPRHLRRMFEAEVGATPSAIARSRRAHFARRLLDETDLTITDIAFASGFSSIRQMNRVMRDIFRFSPTELRRRRRHGDVVSLDGGVGLRVPYLGALDLDATFTFLAARAITGVEEVVDRVYRRTFDSCGHTGVIEVADAGDGMHLLVRAHLPTYATLIDDVARVRHLFALDHDPAEAVAHLRMAPLIAPAVADNVGIRLPGAWDRFETGLRIIVGQHVSVAAATTVVGRMVERLSAPTVTDERGSLARVFPPADVVAEADLGGLGMTGARAEAVSGFATAVASGELDLTEMGDLDAICGRLESLRGVGPWTAHLMAMRLHHHPSAFPSSDVGLRAGAAALGDGTRPTGAQLDALANNWKPWRAHAAAHLWHAAASAPAPTRRMPGSVPGN